MICFICAMDIEYNTIKERFVVNSEIIVDSNCKISECDYGTILIVKTGIGTKLSENYTKYIVKKYNQITKIYSVGIAGALSEKLKIGDIVISDMIVSYGKDKILYEYKSIVKDKSKFDNKLKGDHILIGKIISSYMLINDKVLKEFLYNEKKALCVEMESAGVLTVCNDNNILFRAIKIISDYADDKAITSVLKQQVTVMNLLANFLKSYSIIGQIK